MGAISVLDYACTLEATINAVQSSAPCLAAEPDDSELVDSDRDKLEEELTAPLLPVLDEPWLDMVSGKDPRFAEVVPAGGGTVRTMIDNWIETVLDGRAHDANKEFLEAIPKITALIEVMEQQTLEESLSEFLAPVSRLKGNRLRALIRRLGWGGEPPLTLEAAAGPIGVTRERLRQLQDRTKRSMPNHPVLMPALDRALEVLKADAPISVESASQILVARGVSQDPFHPMSVIKAAIELGRTPGIQIEDVGGAKMVVRSEDAEVSAGVATIALRQARASGASNLLEVAAEADETGLGANEMLIEAALSNHPDIEFLDSRWFWCPGRTTRLENVSQKMLSVVSPIGLSTLREGVRRQYRFLKTRGNSGWPLAVPPRSVLQAFYSASSSFRVDDNGSVSSTKTLDYRTILSPSEQVLVASLRTAATGVVDRSTLMRDCVARGLNQNTLTVLTTYSPLLEHLGTDLWCLRGLQVDPAAVEYLRKSKAARPRERRVLDYGWTEGGSLWVGVRLPHRIEDLHVGLPAAVKRFVVGRDFIATTERGTVCGKIRVYENGTSWGYDDFLARSGADEGDVLLAKFDLTRPSVTLILGDDDLLEPH
jgi:hypothetical protein